MDFWNAMSFGAAVGDALGFNASQKAALQLMAMQPDKVPQKNNSVRVEIEIDPEIAEASEVLQGLQRIFEYRSAHSRVFSHE